METIARCCIASIVLHCIYCIALHLLYCVASIVLHCIYCIALHLLYCVASIVLRCIYCITLHLLYCISSIVLHLLYCSIVFMWNIYIAPLQERLLRGGIVSIVLCYIYCIALHLLYCIVSIVLCYIYCIALHLLYGIASIVLHCIYCIVLHLYIYMTPLTVRTDQTCFRCKRYCTVIVPYCNLYSVAWRREPIVRDASGLGQLNDDAWQWSSSSLEKEAERARISCCRSLGNLFSKRIGRP